MNITSGKSGYTQVGDAAHRHHQHRTAMEEEEETALFLGQESASSNGSGHYYGSGIQPKKIAFYTVIVALLVMIIAATCHLFYNATSNTKTATTTTTTTASIVAPEDALAEPYRPICITYPSSAGATNARVLQTSMGQPSTPWSARSCESGVVAHKDPVVQLNAFGSPDAILHVQFTTVPMSPTKKATTTTTTKDKTMDVSKKDTADVKPSTLLDQQPLRPLPPILGFGGAFTEASARNFNTLSEQGKEAVMELLFGKTGLGYAVGRIPMNSCDFTTASYNFDFVDDDFALQHFDTALKHDVATGMVDMALRAVSLLRQAWTRNDDDDLNKHIMNDPTAPVITDGTLRLFASPWSPPAWMKLPVPGQDWLNATHAANMTGSAMPVCLRDGVGPQSKYAAAWALYFSKFVQSYQNLGLPFWAVTVQNEPEFPAPWEACSYTPELERDFISNHLGPILRQDHPDLKILIFDHNKDHVNIWFDTILNETSLAAPYVDGTAYHWYAGGMDRLLDGAVGAPNMHRLQDNLRVHSSVVRPDHIILGSESCHCPTTGYSGGDIEVYWSRAERYAHTILADLAAGSQGWLEWNLILDSIGGPNHLGNLCDSSLLAVPHRALDADPNMMPLPSFESQVPFGNVSIGDGRTREEMDSLGFPAEYLDLGVAVQPLYYYMGHISRHVRPGSRAVHGLVHSSVGLGRIFRPPGKMVAGGGQNDLARDGIEITVWPCEGSTRQQFTWTVTEQKHIEVYGHDWLGVPTKSCFAKKVDPSLLGLLLTSCDGHEAGAFDMVALVNEPEPSLFQMRLTSSHKTEKCLTIEKLANNGGAYGPLGGAQVVIGNCTDPSSKWKVDAATHEISSNYFGVNHTVCMTTGWPFLQMGAFVTPNGDGNKTVVILNEARDSANFALQDGMEVLLTASIPPRSIQTILLD